MIISANTLLISSMHIVKNHLMTDLAIVRIFQYHNMYANVEYLKFLADATTHQERVIFD